MPDDPTSNLRDQPVPLHVAASVVHQQLSGSTRLSWDGRNDEAYGAVLDSTALALSQVSDIYYVSAQGDARRIPQEELAVGMFEGGARLFRTRSGNVYQSLSMRRGDMADAIAILRKAHGGAGGAAASKTGSHKELK